MRKAILKNYKDVVNTVPLNPLVGNMGLPVDQLCVEVEMIEDAKSQQHKPKDVQDARNKHIKTYRELLYKDKKPAKRIFLRGEAGYGKTCYALRLVSSWQNVWLRKENEEDDRRMSDNTKTDSDIDDIMIEFDFLFYVAFRFLEKEHTSVVDIVCKDYFLSDTEQSQQLKSNIEKVLRSSHYKCLVILDGLDESKLTDLPRHGHLENCQLLYTSRPSKLDMITPTYRQEDKVVAILGLEKFSLSKLVTNILVQYYNVTETEQEDKHKLVMSKVSSISTQQLFLLDIPILAPYLIVQIYEDESLKTESLTRVYLGIFQMLISKAIKQRRLSSKMLETFKGEKVCSKHFRSEVRFPLLKLGELAYKDLVNNACLVFKDRELRETLDDDVIDFAINSGIMCQSNVIGKTTGEKSANFLHKSMQEFLAAYFLACEDEVFEHFLKFSLCTVENYVNLTEICVYLSGLKPGFGTQISERVVELANADERVYKRRQGPFYNDNTFADDNVLEQFNYSQCRCRREFHTSTTEGKFHMADVTISKNTKEYMTFLTDNKTICCGMACLQDTKREKRGYLFNRLNIESDEDEEDKCTCMPSESDVNKILENSNSLTTLAMRECSFATSCSLHPPPVEMEYISLPLTLSVLSINDVVFRNDSYIALNRFLKCDNKLEVLHLYCIDQESDFNSGRERRESISISGCKNLKELILGDYLGLGGRFSYKESVPYSDLNIFLTDNNTIEVLHLNNVRTGYDDDNGVCISGCTNLRELYCSDMSISYIDITECSKLSIFKLDTERSQITDPGSVEIIFPPLKTNVSLSSEQVSINEGKNPFFIMALPHNKHKGPDGNKCRRLGVVSLPNENQLRILDVSGAQMQMVNLAPFIHLQELVLNRIVLMGKIELHHELFCSLCSGVDFVHDIDLANNKNLTNVELDFYVETKQQNIRPRLPVAINLPNSYQMQHLAISNAKLKKLDLKPVYQLCELTLSHVTISEIDLPHSSKLTELRMTESLTSRIDMRNAVMLRDVTLDLLALPKETESDEEKTLPFEINLQHGIHIQNIMIGNVAMKQLDLSLVTNLCRLTLTNVTIPGIDLSHNAKLTTLHVNESCIQYVNLENAVMLCNLEIKKSKKFPFKSMYEKRYGFYTGSKSPTVEINLPRISHLQNLTIENVSFELDLSSVSNLQTLTFSDVTMSKIDIPGIKDLTALNVIHSLIRHINLADANTLSDVSLCFESQVEINLLHTCHMESVREEYSHPVEESLLQSSRRLMYDTARSTTISLPNTNNIKKMTIVNAVLQTMNLTQWNQLESLELDQVVITEMTVSNNDRMTNLSLKDASIQEIYLENNKKLTTVSLMYSEKSLHKEQLSTEIHIVSSPQIQHLTIANAKLKTSIFQSITNLRTLTLENVTFSEISVKNNTDIDVSHMEDTTIHYIDLSKAIMLQKMHLTQRLQYTSKKNGVLEMLLPNNPHLQHITVKNAQMKKIDLSPVTNLRTLTLNNVIFFVIDCSNNTKLTKLNVKNSHIRQIDLTNAIMLRDLTLDFKKSNELIGIYTYLDCQKPLKADIRLPKSSHLKHLTISMAMLQNLDLPFVPYLQKLTLCNVAMPEIDFSSNTKLTKLHVKKSCIQQFDLSNAVMLRDVIFDFESSKENIVRSGKKTNEDRNTLRVEINLPHSSHLQSLSITSAQMDQLDLSVVPNLRQLDLSNVTVSEIDLTSNNQIIKLGVSECCIKYMNLANGSKLSDLRLYKVSAPQQAELTVQDKYMDEALPLAVEIKLPNSPHLRKLEIIEAVMQTLDLSPVTNLRTLYLSKITMPTLDLPGNSQLTKVDVMFYTIRQFNLVNAEMLTEVNLHWPRTPDCTEKHGDKKEKELLQEIKLPKTSCLQYLSIRNARLKTLDLSPVTQPL